MERHCPGHGPSKREMLRAWYEGGRKSTLDRDAAPDYDPHADDNADDYDDSDADL